MDILSGDWSISYGNGNCEVYQRVGRGMHWIVWDLSMTNSIFKGWRMCWVWLG